MDVFTDPAPPRDVFSEPTPPTNHAPAARQPERVERKYAPFHDSQACRDDDCGYYSCYQIRQWEIEAQEDAARKMYSRRLDSKAEPKRVFEQTSNRMDPKRTYIRTGVTRWPRTYKVSQAPTFAMYTPDYLCDGEYIECLPVGADGLIRISRKQWEALVQWDAQTPVQIFAYSASLDRSKLVRLTSLERTATEDEAFFRVF